MSKFQILLSCMNQENKAILKYSNINSDAVIINQCGKNKRVYYRDENKSIIWIDSISKGLSKSRNLAIFNSNAEINLISDDDVCFLDTCENNIIAAFNKYTDFDIITFNIINLDKKNSDKEYEIRYIESLRTSSIQIAFRRESIIKNNILFDEKMGSGTGNGSGEENKFLFDCIKAGLKIIHVPIEIGSLKNKDSSWFNGFTKEYFINRGWSTRRYIGLPLSILYALYFGVFKYKRYKNTCTIFKAIKYMFKGIVDKR